MGIYGRLIYQIKSCKFMGDLVILTAVVEMYAKPYYIPTKSWKYLRDIAISTAKYVPEVPPGGASGTQR